MKYVAFYDLPEYKDENRSAFPSSVAVVSYMMELFSSVEPVTVFSPARTLNKKGFYRARTHRISESVTLKLPMSFGAKNPASRLLIVAYTSLWLFFTLLFTVKRGEAVVAYHSMSTIWVLRAVKRIKHIKLIEQVLEVYSDVNRMSEKKKAAEYRHFARADRFIFATELINQKLNPDGRPYVVVPATYKSEPRIAERYRDGEIHVVYAGTLRISKGGAINAVKAAQYLPDSYHLHVVGYGNAEEIQALTDTIDAVRQENPSAKISYDGLLSGDAFKAYLQRCQIGLSTQTPDGAYNATSFPSKIMTYLANGLQVLSIRIPAVETSPVGPYVNYYDTQDAKTLADAIRSVPIDDNYDPKSWLDKLHATLLSDMKALLTRWNDPAGGTGSGSSAR